MSSDKEADGSATDGCRIYWAGARWHRWPVPLGDTRSPIRAETQVEEADVLAELNDTDGDLGFHALIDADAWDRLTVRDPNGRAILSVRPRRSLALQGMTELFFESAEPEFDELAPAEFFERFPEGRYTISGRTLLGRAARRGLRGGGPAGGQRARRDQLGPGHHLPPGDRQPHLRADQDRALPVGGRARGADAADPQIDLPGNLPAYEITVPPEFIALGEEFKYEILARARNHNQTALESCFAVE